MVTILERSRFCLIITHSFRNREHRVPDENNIKQKIIYDYLPRLTQKKVYFKMPLTLNWCLAGISEEIELQFYLGVRGFFVKKAYSIAITSVYAVTSRIRGYCDNSNLSVRETP